MRQFLLAVCLILVANTATAEEIKLEQIISREDPAFHCESAKLAIGRDGMIHLASGGTPSFVIRLNPESKEKIGSNVGYALTGVAANADGIVAISNAHFSHRVALFDRSLKEIATVDDFLVNDQEGWDAPSHVEAGSRDFYGVDQHRNRIVRLTPAGKVLRSFPIPRNPSGSAGLVQDIRVDESRETFYLLSRSGPIRLESPLTSHPWTDAPVRRRRLRPNPTLHRRRDETGGWYTPQENRRNPTPRLASRPCGPLGPPQETNTNPWPPVQHYRRPSRIRPDPPRPIAERLDGRQEVTASVVFLRF